MAQLGLVAAPLALLGWSGDAALWVRIADRIEAPTLLDGTFVREPPHDGDAEPVELTVGSNGEVRVGSVAVTSAELPAALERAMRASGRKDVLLDAADDAPFSVVVQAMDVARGAGATVGVYPEPIAAARGRYTLRLPRYRRPFYCGGAFNGDDLDDLARELRLQRLGSMLAFALIVLLPGIVLSELAQRARNRRDRRALSRARKPAPALGCSI